MEKRNQAREQYRQVNEKFTSLKSEFDTIRSQRQEADNALKRTHVASFRSPEHRSLHQPLESESYFRKESTVLDYGQQQVEDFIQIGQVALENLKLQRSVFKGAEKRVLDVAQRLGVSDSVIRFIQRRQGSDRVIFWCSVLGSLMFLLWIVYRRIF